MGRHARPLGLGRDPDHPRDNILAVTLYLRLMYDRFGYPGLFGAYNAGLARYARHLATGQPLPGEARAYLTTVAGSGPSRSSMRMAERGSAWDSLFVTLGPASESSTQIREGALFVSLAGGVDRAELDEED